MLLNPLEEELLLNFLGEGNIRKECSCIDFQCDETAAAKSKGNTKMNKMRWQGSKIKEGMAAYHKMYSEAD
ncbi:hypothetical protein L1987_86947 [Smallanthus sonchifolius]|uniref:Uncharacterized protein n=1 Tax=Smallanthus sonchifolius TaxID=185202 RepID=A0ACB8Y0S4_9ASTR|nr:hypothetical protein L1987_86947 [Smallanthus sonchifolius]